MSDKIKVLFVCIENSCRSQIAEGFANYMGKGVLEAYSAGSNPSGSVNVNAIKVMLEIGIDISRQKSKGFDAISRMKFNYVITLGCKDICPFVPAEKHVEWEIDDPKGKDLDSFRTVRDQIKDRVTNFIEKEG